MVSRRQASSQPVVYWKTSLPDHLHLRAEPVGRRRVEHPRHHPAPAAPAAPQLPKDLVSVNGPCLPLLHREPVTINSRRVLACANRIHIGHACADDGHDGKVIDIDVVGAADGL